MKTVLACAAALMLVGCGTTTEPQVRTVEVKVPVRVACVPADLPPKPASYADSGLTAGTPPDERYKAIATANAQRTARLARTEPIIDTCR
jgi:hypothetical protein